MKVSFGELKKAVSRVKATVAKAGTFTAFSRICIRNGKMSSFDGMTGTITSCVLSDEFEFTVPAKKLIALTDVLDKREGTIEHTNNWLHVKAGNYSTKIPTFDVIDFPDLMPKSKAKIFCQASNLVECLRACVPTMETDENRLKLYGVAFHKQYIYSTDGKRITRAVLDSAAEDTGKPVSIAQPAVQQIIRFGQPKYLFWSAANIGALYPDTKTVLIARTTTGTFPFELADTALAQGSDKWTFSIPPTLLEVVDRVKALVDDEEAQLILRCDGTTLTIATKKTDTGHAEEEIQWPVGFAFEIKVKASSLRSTLYQLKPTHIDLTDLAEGQSRMLLFQGIGFQHCLALMS